jgi:hypothetical protein
MIKQKRRSVLVSTKLYERVRRLAKLHNLTVSEYASRLLAQQLADVEAGGKEA